MEQKTSIHIRPCNVGSVEDHNLRTEHYLNMLLKSGKDIYIFPELSQHNDTWENPKYQGLSCLEIQDKLIDLYRKKIGQKPNLKDKVRINKKTGKEYTIAGWSPVREGVIVIDANTSMEQLKHFADKVQEKWNIKTIRIDIHHDEGYKNELTGEIKHNRHAHIVFDWIDHQTGKSIKLNSEDMVAMQDILAESLQLQRGKSSDKKHLTALQFKNKAEEERLSEIKKQTEQKINTLEEINKDLQKAQKELQEAKDAYEVGNKVNNNLKAEISQKKQEISKIKEEITNNNETLLKQAKAIKKGQEVVLKYEELDINEDAFDKTVDKTLRAIIANEAKNDQSILNQSILLSILKLTAKKLYNLISDCFRTKISELRKPEVIDKLYKGEKQVMQRNDGNIDTFHCHNETGKLYRNGYLIFPDVKTQVKNTLKNKFKL